MCPPREDQLCQAIPILVTPLVDSPVATFYRAMNDTYPYLETHKITTMTEHHHFAHRVRPQLSYFTDGQKHGGKKRLRSFAQLQICYQNSTPTDSRYWTLHTASSCSSPSLAVSDCPLQSTQPSSYTADLQAKDLPNLSRTCDILKIAECHISGR